MSDFRPVLLVIDCQNGFVASSSEHVIPVIAGLAARWMDAGGPAVFTRYRNYPDSPYERLVGWHGLQGSPDTDLAPELADLAEHPMAQVTDKVTYTALDDSGRQVLAPYTDLVICGIATDGCVLATAISAFDEGWTPWILADACASNATSADPRQVHHAAMLIIPRLIGAGQVITAGEALSMLPAACLEA